MLLKAIDAAPRPAAPMLALGVSRGQDPPGVPREQTWRQVPGIEPAVHDGAAVIASRWTDDASGRPRAEAEAPPDRYVVGIALRRTRIRLTSGRRQIFDGVMTAGSVHITSPSRRIAAEFYAPCDFMHLYVTRDSVRKPEGGGRADGATELDDVVVRDPLAGQLAWSLTEDVHAGDPLYIESVARTVLIRLAARTAPRPEVSTLSKWRLRRVQEYVQKHLAGSISLGDLARAAGLSRSYFAAQFRASTGCRPHDYITEQRIEHAKGMLADGSTPIIEIALAVGFQTQSHFSTVFKQQTGTTPARYRRDHLEWTGPSDGQRAILR
jgi:AraC-like DNA-binding protein